MGFDQRSWMQAFISSRKTVAPKPKPFRSINYIMGSQLEKGICRIFSRNLEKEAHDQDDDNNDADNIEDAMHENFLPGY
jgi:hypothetical protein